MTDSKQSCMRAPTKRRQAGFGVVAVLALVIIVGIIGFTAWFVTASSKKASSTLELTTKTNTNAPAAGTKLSDPSMPSSNKADDTIQKITLSKTPKDLQTAIIAATPPDCVKNGQVVDGSGKVTDQDVVYVATGFAKTGVGCGEGGSATIFAKSSSTWQKVGSSQFQFVCSALQKYKVPTSFMQAIDPDPSQPVKCLPDDPNATDSQVYKL